MTRISGQDLILQRMLHCSVVVTMLNSKDTIVSCLHAIRASTYPAIDIIVVDSGSTDDSCALAKPYADFFLLMAPGTPRGVARSAGLRRAQGDIVVNVDADVVITVGTLARIVQEFICFVDLAALTGILSRVHPHAGFFSQYKNLYMHYIFHRLHRDITFLYGSLFAVRRCALPQVFGEENYLADDTALGQLMASEGKKIVLLKELEVVHLKRHTLVTFIINDFRIPYDWAQIFLNYNGWRHLGNRGGGFAHASISQVLAIVLMNGFLGFCLLALCTGNGGGLAFFCWILWLFGNGLFFFFLYREKGFVFAACSVGVTALDHTVMGIGILCGTVFFFIKKGRSFLRY